ncbi:activator of the mannose operon (transcriptional antiterminator) [Paenibacillus sp. RC73]|uniref:Uncharacterized protein n=1 Tax=Paenibacillus terrae TaxID=159743 RepID=A0A0D7X175_9BACL|nr:BglG family transcription antiterminator [Paenibacillus terrae]KJD45201.1 hypothetical protein QD47_13100 [Paenibacillus terrae]
MNDLSSRQKKLLQMLISETEYRPISLFARALQVSERTVHNDLNELKNVLDGKEATLNKQPGIGIQLHATASARLRLLNMAASGSEGDDPLSTGVRRCQMAMQMLSTGKTTSVQKLSEAYYVSRTSIVADLEWIERWGSNYNLTLVKNRIGTQLAGKEEDIRKALYAAVVMLMADGPGEPYNLTKGGRLNTATRNKLAGLFGDNEVMNIEGIVNNAEQMLSYRFNDYSYMNLLIQLLILVNRLRLNRQIELDDTTIVNASNVAESLADQIALHFQVDINDKEKMCINFYLMSSGMDNPLVSSKDAWLESVDEDMKILVKDMIRLFSEMMKVDFSEETVLYQGLLMHIKPMIHRLRHSSGVKNPHLDEIKQQYGAMFAATCLISSSIEHNYGIRMNEDEIGYLTIHFQAAMERNASIKKTIIVCSGGIGTSQLIANRIQRFVPQIQIADILPLSRFEQTDLAGIDFVISTVPIELHDDTPVVTISPLVSKKDIQNINYFYLDYVYEREKQTYNPVYLSRVLLPELCVAGAKVSSREEAVANLTNRMHEMGFINSEFEATVFRREALTPTSLGNGVAIPHGEVDHVLQSKIAVMSIPEGVDWGGEQVYIVFLIALKLDDELSAKEILNDLYNLLDSDYNMNRLRICQDHQRLYELLAGKGE